MQVNLLNSQNIFIPKQNYQTRVQEQRFNSVKNDAFMKNNPTFTGLSTLKILKPFQKLFVKNQSLSTELNPETILKPFKQFGIPEYKQLTIEQIEALRSNLSRELIKARDVTMIFSANIKSKLNKEYRNGYVFVSIGRSPAVIGKALEYQGIDVLYAPISHLGKYPSETFEQKKLAKIKPKLLEYYKYLSNIGLSREKIQNNDKIYVFADYKGRGGSFKNFKAMMKSNEININSDNIVYKDLNEDIIIKGENIKTKYKLEDLISVYLHWNGLKRYAHYGKLKLSKIHQIQKWISKPYSDECKQMNFALIDYFAQKGLLKE